MVESRINNSNELDDLNNINKTKVCIRAADNIITILEERIYKGELKEGKMFPAERELSEEFGISRTVAREVVKALGERGLVKIEHRHRPVVKQPDYHTALSRLGGLAHYLVDQPQGVKDLFNVRIFIESGLVRSAALDAQKEDIANLRQALEENRLNIENSEKFYETDMKFHSVLYKIPNNPIFPAVHQSFCEWLSGHWKRMPLSTERNVRNYRAHQAILEAILNRDPDQAEVELKKHLQRSWDQVKNTFDL